MSRFLLFGSGKFREDLYLRLNVLTIVLPPLCDRRTRAIVLAPGGIITPDCIQFPNYSPDEVSTRLEQVPYHDRYWQVIRQVEIQMVKAVLGEAQGNKAEAARLLGIRRRLLYEKLSELGLS